MSLVYTRIAKIKKATTKLVVQTATATLPRVGGLWKFGMTPGGGAAAGTDEYKLSMKGGTV